MMAKTTLVAVVLMLALNKQYIECAMLDCRKATYATTNLIAFVAQCTPASWKTFFDQKEVQEDINLIAPAMSKEAKKRTVVIEPPMPLMFRALELVRPDQIRVVILGQDPTPQAGEATGLAFSVRDPRTVGTVLNVLLEVSLEGWSVDISKGDLTKWANQGVLLLNAALTVERNNAGAHIPWWNIFTRYLIQYISNTAQPSVWILWGAKAQSYQPLIEHKTKHYVIAGGHPSALGGLGINTFFGGNYFYCANQFLSKKGRGTIDWGLAVPNDERLAIKSPLNPCPPEPVAPTPTPTSSGKHSRPFTTDPTLNPGKKPRKF